MYFFSGVHNFCFINMETRFENGVPNMAEGFWGLYAKALKTSVGVFFN